MNICVRGVKIGIQDLRKSYRMAVEKCQEIINPLLLGMQIKIQIQDIYDNLCNNSVGYQIQGHRNEFIDEHIRM